MNPKIKHSRDRAFKRFVYIFFFLMCACFVLPLIVVISASFTSEQALTSGGFSLLPRDFTLDAYKSAFSSGTRVLRAYGVTIFQAVVGTVLSSLVAALAAYPLSRSNFRFRRPITVFIFFTMLFSAGMIPNYIIFAKYYKLADSIWIYILPGITGGAWNTMVFRTFFKGLPETLFESELFGHEKGAFTGAHAARAGLVEAAHGGTLFLDEVGDIPLSMQVKLLRLLEGGTYRRVGQTELRRADIRLVAATHRDLRAMVREGRFRQDLYYRLSTFPIHLPPLRERVPDIGLLAPALLARVAPGRSLVLEPAALRRLLQHPFPGNVRELRNVLERAALLSDGDRISAQTMHKALSFDAPFLPASAAEGAPLRTLQAQALREALPVSGRTRSEQAQALPESSGNLPSRKGQSNRALWATITSASLRIE